jgi:hypothetical protein
MIVVGVDAHKRTHTLVAIDAGTGELRGQRTVAASDDGSTCALRFAGELGEERVWAIEDCRHVSGRLGASADRCWRVGDPDPAGVDSRRASGRSDSGEV